jgi:ribonuclease HI
MKERPLLRIHTDGASRGNPGAAAYAYTIEQDGRDDVEEADCIGRMTNNKAEYTALVKALEHALEDLGDNFQVRVHSDSELMVKQMNGEYRVKDADLRPLYEEARALSDRFQGGVQLVHVRRSQNTRADALCNEALDGKRTATPRASTVHGAKASSSAKLPAAKLPVATKPASPSRLRDEAIARLRRAAEAWAGGVLEPSPERVWGEIVDLLTRNGVALPPGAR